MSWWLMEIEFYSPAEPLDDMSPEIQPVSWSNICPEHRIIMTSDWIGGRMGIWESVPSEATLDFVGGWWWPVVWCLWSSRDWNTHNLCTATYANSLLNEWSSVYVSKNRPTHVYEHWTLWIETRRTGSSTQLLIIRALILTPVFANIWFAFSLNNPIERTEWNGMEFGLIHY